MWKSLLRRFIIFIPQIIGLSILIFILAEFMPGDALTGVFVEDPTMTEEIIQEHRDRLGLDDPWYQRYSRWVIGLVQGDFGYSILHRRPVIDIVGERMGNTLMLSLVSTIMIYLFSIPFGIIAGRYKGQFAERAISFYNFIQIAVPMVVVAIALQWLFAIQWQILPLRGSVNVLVLSEEYGWWAQFMSRIEHTLLPAAAGSILAGVGIVQFLGNEINEQKQLDYVTLAKCKGVPMGKIYTSHIFRNSLLPIAAGFGSIIVGLFGGAIIIENLFTYQGMGQLFATSIGQQDWPVANFLIIFYATLSLIGFFLSDIALTIFDPRIRIK